MHGLTPSALVTAVLSSSMILVAACGGASTTAPTAASPQPSATNTAGGEPEPSHSADPASASTAPASAAASSNPPANADAAATNTTSSANPSAAASGQEPGACAGLLNADDGVGAPSRTALASYWLNRGFGDAQRFEVMSDHTITYVSVDRHEDAPRCFRGTVTPEAIAAFREALLHAHACTLPHDTGTSALSDRGPLAFAFRLPGLACQPRLVPGHGQNSEARMNTLEAVYHAFDILGAPVCGQYCRRGE